MSKSFRLPFLPRQNSVLTQMPVLRVTVEVLHPENFTKESAAAAAQKILADRLSMILSYYRAQQANAHVSDLPLSQTHKVASGVEVRHTNLNGTPILDVKVTVDADAEADSALMMMVLHSGNKIAAFDMKALDAGKLAKTYSADLSQSSWGSEPMRTTQYRYSKTETAVFMPAAFDATITATNYHQLSRTVDKNIAKTLTQSVASRLHVIDQYPLYFSYKVPNEPIITNSGSTFYTAFDRFQIGQNGITVAGDGASLNNPYTGLPDPVFSVDSQGNLFTFVGYSYIWPLSSPIVDPHWMAYDFSVGYDVGQFTVTGASQSVYQYAYTQFPYSAESVVLAFDYIGYYQNTTPVAEVAYTEDYLTQELGQPTDHYVDPNLGTRVPYMTCTTVNGLDILDASTERLEVVMSGTYIAIGDDAGKGLIRTTTFAGVSVSDDAGNSGMPYDRISFSVTAWPPAYNGKPFFILDTETNGDFVKTVTAYTPYGQIEITQEAVNSFPKIDGLVHASNGKHVVQGFRPMYVAGTYLNARYYLDGTEIGAKLATLCGCSVDDIQSILLDIPLARIKQFK